MKILTMDQDTENCRIMIQAESPEDTVAMLKLFEQVKKPVLANGHIENNGLAWGWILIPKNKKVSGYDAVRFGNAYK